MLKPSTLADLATGQDIVSDKRTSCDMFLRIEENDFIARIDCRLSRLMNRPLKNGEGLQVLHDLTGAGSDPHSLPAPVAQGEKWLVTKWMRHRRFVPMGRRP